jgi:hypothetical protein
LRFEYSEDKQYFYDLLCVSGEDLSRYASLFDFRSASVKRRPSKKVEKGSIFLPSIWASPLGAHFDFGPHSLLGCMAT